MNIILDMEEEKPVYYLMDPEAAKIMAESNKEIAKQVNQTFREMVNALKDYYLKTRKIVDISGFILIGGITLIVALLTFIGKVGGETFAFFAGTIIGYIIGLLPGRR